MLSRCLVVILALFFSCSSVSHAESLLDLSKDLNIDANQISVSGVSSGAYMALQIQVAYSKRIKGAGIIAGGPYRCAAAKYVSRWFDPAGMYTMLSVCTHANPLTWWRRELKPDVNFSIRETERLVAAKLIDDPANLAKHKVWMLSGAKDLLVPIAVMDTLQTYYQHFMPATHIAYVKSSKASHGMVTESQGGSCSISLPPFINDCDFDAAGALFTQIYGALQVKTAARPANLHTFNQQAFFDVADKSISLHENAHIYLPEACQRGQRCRLHIAFHGCMQSEDMVGDAFYQQAGYNEWAETNRIVVLYPQIKAWGGNDFALDAKRNLQGCWDWWGYSGEHYADKEGKQIQAISKMLAKLKIRLN